MTTTTLNFDDVLATLSQTPLNQVALLTHSNEDGVLLQLPAPFAFGVLLARPSDEERTALGALVLAAKVALPLASAAKAHLEEIERLRAVEQERDAHAARVAQLQAAIVAARDAWDLVEASQMVRHTPAFQRDAYRNALDADTALYALVAEVPQ